MTDKEDKWFVKRMEDLARTADRDGYAVCSDFLNEHQQQLVRSLEPGLPVSVYYTGGYDGAERVVAVFCPVWNEAAREEGPDLQLLRVTLAGARFLTKRPGHRDYLGALMGCGIQREKLGDIGLEDEGAWIWVKQEIASYLCDELTSVGSVLCRTEPAQWDGQARREEARESVISVSSLRLDSVVSRGFHLSRGTAAEEIRAGRVYLNGSLLQQPDRAVKPNDSVTLRGKGKLRILEEVGVSRSDRIQLRVERLGK